MRKVRTIARSPWRCLGSAPKTCEALLPFPRGAIVAEQEPSVLRPLRHHGRVDTEPPSDVWSDDRIVAELRREGVDIARRTVAKYREAMRIPSSVQRRREKQIGL